MPKSSTNIENEYSLAEITTYQSGVAQSSAFRIIKHHTAHFLKDYDLSCMQWFIVGTILDTGKEGIRISDLAKKLDTTMAYMTTTVNMLESRNIIAKRSHQTDARTKIVTVKPSYRKTCADIELGLRKHLAKILYTNISRDELETYVKVLYKLSTLR